MRPGCFPEYTSHAIQNTTKLGPGLTLPNANRKVGVCLQRFLELHDLATSAHACVMQSIEECS